MLSYELLELLEYMPAHGAFKTAMRGGEYTEEQLAIRHGINEIARLRATMHAVHGGQRYEPPTLPSKAEMIAEMEDAQAAEERREEIYSAFDRDHKMIEA